MKLNSKLIFVLAIFSLLILLPSAFAAEIDDNSTISADSGHQVFTGSDDEGIIFDESTFYYNEGSEGEISGTLYGSGDYYSGESFDAASIDLSYSYTGSDNVLHKGVVYTDDGKFNLDLSSLKGLTNRESPYVFTFHILDSDGEYSYYCDIDDYPSDVTTDLYVTKGKVIELDKLYVATDGDDDIGDGSVNNPYKTIQKAVDISKENQKSYDICIKEGTYVISSPIKNDAFTAVKLNFIGLGNVILDMQKSSIGMDISQSVSVTNIKFINALSSSSSAYGGAIKMSSSTAKKLEVNNCTFINCNVEGSGSSGGAISTYYGGTGSLKVVNSTFINCSSPYNGGAIAVGPTGATIINCTFTNCSSKYGGAIYFRSNGEVSYSVFINNAATYASDIYSSSTNINADYNYWGSNSKPSTDSINSKVIVNNWVIVDYTVNYTQKVYKGDKIKIDFNLNKFTNGLSNYSLSQNMPSDIVLTLNSKLGTLNQTSIKTVNGKASVLYTATTKGTEIISVSAPKTSFNIKFDVLAELSSIIYVATDGNDNTGDGSINNPYKTITRALGDVTPTRNTVFIKNGTYDENDIEIDKNVTIIGEDKDAVIIDGQNYGRIFIISNDAVIKSLTLTRGTIADFADEYYGFGGAIYLDSGNLILNDTIIKDSTAAAGGAVGVYAGSSGSLTIVNSELRNNKVDSLLGYVDNAGGAIYTDSNLIVDNCKFIANSAYDDYNTQSFDGGAITLLSSGNITNSIFESNTATDAKGGAISINPGNNGLVIISNNTFKSNSASDGGAIYSTLSKLTTISNNTFIENEATKGGAIEVVGLKANDSIINNIFKSNIANSGTALFIDYGTVKLSGNKMDTIENVIYLNRGPLSVDTYGSAVNNSTIKAANSEKINLTAIITDLDGNPITNQKVSFFVNDIEVGTNVTNKEGIAILAYDVTNDLGIYPVTITLNDNNGKSTIEDGTLEVSTYSWFIGDKKYFTLQDAVDASVEGDVITGLPGTYHYTEIHIGDRIKKIYKNVTIKADKLGDIVFEGVDGKLFNVAAKNANDRNHTDSQLVLENIVIRDFSDEYGGAIYNDGYLVLINCLLVNNTSTSTESSSKWHGGAIMGWGDLKIYNSTFDSNHGLAGAAIYTEVLDDDQGVYIENTKFINNAASNEGGAIYFAGLSDNINLVNVTFINNSASAGGAIFAYASMVLTNCTLINNTAVNSGGAIYTLRENLTLNHVYIENNSAQYGGALLLLPAITNYWYDDTFSQERNTFVINDCIIKNNVATVEGGAICAGKYYIPTGYIRNTQFINNTAGEIGGAISVNEGYVDIKNSTFDSNKANLGAAIYSEGLYNDEQMTEYPSEVNVTDSIFFNNVAGVNGTVYNANIYSTMNIKKSIFGEEGISIFNYGDLYLQKNIINTTYPEIFNNGTIISTVNVIVLNNSTVRAKPGELFDLKAIVTDDNKNMISGGTFKFILPDEKLDCDNCTNGVYIKTITVANESSILVGASYSKAVNTNILTGLISTSNYETSISLKDVVMYYNNGSSLVAILTDSFGDVLANKNLTFIVDGKSYEKITDSQGRATLDLNLNLDYGIHNVLVLFKGVKEYNPSNSTAIISVLSTINSSNLEKIFKNDSQFYATFVDGKGNPLSNTQITFELDGGLYTRTTDENGTAKFDINLRPGTYNISFTNPNSNEKANNTIVVLSSVNGIDLVKYYRNGTQYYANYLNGDGTPLVGTTVSFNIDGVFYTRTTDENGTAKLNINLRPGKYIITTTNPNNGQYYSNNITVLSTVEGNDIVKYYRNGTQYYAKFLNGDGTPLVGTTVRFNIDGVFYTRTTDENGTAKLNINLRPGKYIITTENPVNNELYSNTIEVLPLIIAKDLVMKHNDGSSFEAQLLDKTGKILPGEEITFNIDGVFYHRITDENGIAKLNINLRAGDYIITSQYSNFMTSNKISIKS